MNKCEREPPPLSRGLMGLSESELAALTAQGDHLKEENTTMEWNNVQQVVRTAMQFIAGYLVSKGVLTDAGNELFIGMGMSAVAFLWWWVWNRPTPPAEPPVA